MAVVIPTFQTLASYRERVQLDGERFELLFRWNACAQSWFLDIFDDEGTPIVFGRRCVVDARLTGQHKHRTDIPPGELMAFDTTQRKLDPGLSDFGTRVLMLYHTQQELEEAEGAIE